MRKKIGIIGYGNMGSAIAERIKRRFLVCVFDKDKDKVRNLKRLTVTENVTDLVSQVDALFLAVKPQDLAVLLAEIRNKVSQKLIISIAAGISTDYIERQLGKVKIVRAMPNLAAKIGQGMTCLCKGKYAHQEELEFAQELFANLGETLVLSEEMMDAVTAISGSGPGFLFDRVEGRGITEIRKYANSEFAVSLARAAQKLGFSPQETDSLVRNTVRGSIALLEVLGLKPGELKKRVASKGGTTEAGLEVLHHGGTIEEAVEAALNRARELVKKE